MIYLGSDHRGFRLKNIIKRFLEELGHDVQDLGPFEYDKDDDYPDYAKLVADKVVGNPDSRGVLFCGSGIGIAIAANKIKGIRAGTAADPAQTKAAVNDEDLNILALAADYIDESQAKEIVEAFVDAKFSGEERHIRRVNKIKELENA